MLARWGAAVGAPRQSQLLGAQRLVLEGSSLRNADRHRFSTTSQGVGSLAATYVGFRIWGFIRPHRECEIGTRGGASPLRLVAQRDARVNGVRCNHHDNPRQNSTTARDQNTGFPPGPKGQQLRHKTSGTALAKRGPQNARSRLALAHRCDVLPARDSKAGNTQR